MKVLYIAHSAGLQGAGFALLNILRGIIRTDITPIVIVPAKGDMFREITEMGIKCYVIPFNMDIYPFLKSFRDLILYIPRFLRYKIFRKIAQNEVNKIIKNENIDIIHTNTGVIHWGGFIAKKLRLPHVWHIREMQDLDFGYRPIGGMTYFRGLCNDKNNHCIAITKSVFEHHSLNNIKDCVIYDGVFSFDMLEKEIIKEKENYFLFVGTLTKAKGVFDAISAFDKIAIDFPELELWVVGNTNSVVIELIENCRNKNRIKLLGFRRDVYQLMSKAKALLVPSYFEGFGFITAEAMINGCLVIGRDTAGTKEQFDNGILYNNSEIGLRFKTQEELETRMRYVCQTSVNELMPILLAAKKVAGNYTIENNIKRIERLYHKVVEK